MIYGKVVTEEGEPVPRAEIQVLRQSFRDGRRVMLPVAWLGGQDDGGFAIGNLEAGTYYVRATPNRAAAADRHVRTDRRLIEEDYVTTFWPNAIDGSSAVPIFISAGAELRGIEVRLRKASVYRIRGKAIELGPAQAASQATLSLRSANDYPADNLNVILANSAGEFEFERVLPGTYIIEASLDSRASTPVRKRLFGRRMLTVGNGNVEDFLIQLGEPAQITGKFTVEGRLTWTSPVQVLLIPVDGTHNTSAIAVRNDGAFQLSGIVPDVYRVKVAGLPDKSYVKTIHFSGQTANAGLVDLTAGDGSIEILVSSEAAELSGVVRNGRGETALGAVVQIWNDANIVRSVTANQDGSFHIAGLAPGEYSLIAWEEVVPELSQDPNFRRRFQPWTTLVSVREASMTNLTMIGVPRELSAAEASQ